MPGTKPSTPTRRNAAATTRAAFWTRVVALVVMSLVMAGRYPRPRLRDLRGRLGEQLDDVDSEGDVERVRLAGARAVDELGDRDPIGIEHGVLRAWRHRQHAGLTPDRGIEPGRRGRREQRQGRGAG